MQYLRLFVVLFALASFGLQASIREEFYSSSSQTFLKQDFISIVSKIQALDRDTTPESTKEIRKEIGNLKLKLDFFMFAFPKTSIGNEDHLNILRDELDNGYTHIGNFKDLYDAMIASGSNEIDQDKIDRLLNKSLSWRDDFIKSSKKRGDLEFISSHSKKDVHLVKERKLPRLVWGAVNYLPKKGDTLGEVADQLILAMLKVVRKNLNELDEVNDLSIYKNEEHFHDTRKILRNALKFNDYFESIVEQESTELAILDSVVDGFGEINDLLIAFHNETKKEKKEKLKKQINQSWKEFKNTLEDQEIEKLIKHLIGA